MRRARHIGRELTPARGSTLMTRPKTEAISPCFIVSNVDQTIAFYRDKLGFETRFREPDPESFFRHHRPRRSANPDQIRQRRLAAPEPQAPSLHEVGRICLCIGPRCACRRICRSWRSLQRAAQGHARRSARLRDLRPGRLRLVLWPSQVAGALNISGDRSRRRCRTLCP